MTRHIANAVSSALSPSQDGQVPALIKSFGRSKVDPTLLDGTALPPYIVIYKRYSTPGQAELEAGQFIYEPSLERQDEECRKVIRDHSLQGEIQDISDSARSGRLATRPGLMRMISLIKDRPGSIIVVEDCDRILRDDEVWHMIAPIIKRTKTDVYDKSGGPLSHMIMNIKMVVASEQRKLLSERSYVGKKQAVRKGCMIGRLPLGYRWSGRGSLEKCPIEAPIVLEIAELFGRDKKLVRDIVKQLRDENKTRRNGKEFTRQNVTQVLNSATVLGWNKVHFKR